MKEFNSKEALLDWLIVNKYPLEPLESMDIKINGEVYTMYKSNYTPMCITDGIRESYGCCHLTHNGIDYVLF